ncbi:MAG: hypothetical protein D6722_00390 [Bacteroidetes bacterium]|nr:MAG: hypothetical protein D6722_00390 [Bacteroidota bacterium]
MEQLDYPLSLTFKIGTLANDFVARDRMGNVVVYVRQKLLKLIDEVQVYRDESRSDLRYTLKANKWIDFSTTYTFTNAQGQEVGRVARQGWASLWKAHYEIFDEQQQPDLTIREANPWVKVADGLLGEVPILGLLTGYFFNPSYLVTRPDGTLVARLTKKPSGLGRRFSLEKEAEFERGEEERVLLSLMMMILLERRRG